MPWVYIEPEYTGPRKDCPVCDKSGRIMYSNPPSPRDLCTECQGRGWVVDDDPVEVPDMREISALAADEGEG